MATIEIPQEHVVPMEDIAPGVAGLRILFVNVFGLSHADGSWTLIDAGVPYSEHTIRSWAEKSFQRPPNAILLTHGHFDHASTAAQLADHWNVPIYAHPLERPYLTGRQEYPAPNIAAGGGLMPLLSPMFPRGPIDLGRRLQDLPNNGADLAPVSMMPGWDVIHTPGHTLGHVSFFRDLDQTLLAGDAFCTTKPESFFESSLAQHPELHGPPSYFTENWNQARESVQALARLAPRTVAPGHGKPISGIELPEKLRELVARFDEVAVPDNKKNAA